MTLKKPGKRILNPEVMSISPFGVWLYVHEREYFLPFEKYPWFQSAPVDSVYHLELLHQNHLHWPDLDVDLELESLDSPEKYPLVYS